MGVTVTFMAILELVREGLIDIVQAEPYAPLHVRGATPARRLRVVADNEESGAAEPAAAPGDPGTDSGEEDATSE
jgi:segregation and condensation protein A